MVTTRELGERIVRRCRELGFAAAGVADASSTARAAELKAWLADGKHGDMSFLEKTLATLLDPAQELPGVRSVIMVADLYASRNQPNASVEPTTSPQGKIARYAQGKDYHAFIKKRLHVLNDELRILYPGHKFRTFTDTAPVLEREYAQRAGLGWIGKHTLAIHPAHGSFFFLGGTYTTLELDPLPDQPTPRDHCGTCTRCIDACPTAAITPYSVDASRCISYLTIERQGPIDPTFHAAIGDWLYGCDICQDVCPHNSPRTRAPGALPQDRYTPMRTGFSPLEILTWDEDARRAAFHQSSMKRASLAMMKRNAIIVLTNLVLGDPTAEWAHEARAKIAEIITRDDDPMVLETARVSLDRLSGSQPAPHPRPESA
jgi:epoxyqueuosine reductase